MNRKDFDKVEIERVDKVLYGAKRNGVQLANFFTSERVIKAFDEDIQYMRSYRQNEIMALLPFSSNLMVSICPGCIRPENFSDFRKLVERDAIIPILTSPYKVYPDAVTEFLTAHSHISVYAMSLYKELALAASSDRRVCVHCVEEAQKTALGYVKGRKNFKDYQFHVRHISQNTWPFVYPDFELVKTVVEFCEQRDLRGLKQLSEVSNGIYVARMAQVLDSPILLRSDQFDRLPPGVLSNNDEASRVSLEMKQFALDGLGLHIPTDMEIDQYIELVSDYRPAITKVVTDVTEGAKCEENSIVTMAHVQREVIRINSEIERVKGLRRSALLDACVGFYRDHPKLVSAGLVMSAFGLSNHLWGCAAAGGVQAVRAAAEKFGAKKQSVEGDRLRRVVKRDLQPLADKLIAAYVGSDARSVSVLSLRKAIEGRITKPTSTNSKAASRGRRLKATEQRRRK